MKVFYFRCLITVYIYLNFSYLEPIKKFATFRQDFNGLQVHRFGIIIFLIRKLTSFSCTEQIFVEFIHVCVCVYCCMYIHIAIHTHTTFLLLVNTIQHVLFYRFDFYVLIKSNTVKMKCRCVDEMTSEFKVLHFNSNQLRVIT